MQVPFQRILIVEDSTNYAKLLTRQLQHTTNVTLTTDVVGRFEVAATHCATQHYDVVLLDLNLPDSTTDETIANLERIAQHAAVVVLTGLEDEAVGLRAVQAGAQDYLVKQEISPGVLVRSLNYAFARRQATDAARRTSELEQVLAEERDLSEQRRQFAAIVSHELNTPLAVILSAAHILYSQHPNITEAQRKAKLDQITANIKSLTDLMENLLVIGRTEHQMGLQLHQTEVDMVVFVQHIVEVLRQLPAPRPQIVLDHPDSPLLVSVDEGLMTIVIDNLLSNACKYAPLDSVVTVRLAHDPTTAAVHLHVIDQGRGIPAMEIDDLWQPFFRASNVQAVRGTGVGLATVKRIVASHGGSVHVASEEGAGSTFTVTLPT